MALLLHAVEDPEGRWTCRRGREQLDPAPGHHPHLVDAVAHLRDVAQKLEGAVQIVLHFADGSAELQDFEP
jgi:hypothetical protein